MDVHVVLCATVCLKSVLYILYVPLACVSDPVHWQEVGLLKKRIKLLDPGYKKV